MANELAAEVGAPPSGQGREGASGPVDLVHLSRHTLGERELEREVLELFCTQSLNYVERLRGAHSYKDWKEAAHSLKGSASAIGAWRAAAAAASAEALPEGALPQARTPHLREIESAVREAEAYIGGLLEDR